MQTFHLHWWEYCGKCDDYVDHDHKVKAESFEEAKQTLKTHRKRAKTITLFKTQKQ